VDKERWIGVCGYRRADMWDVDKECGYVRWIRVDMDRVDVDMGG
jgi:hypothetical protein